MPPPAGNDSGGRPESRAPSWLPDVWAAGMLLVDNRGDIVRLNPEAEKLLARPAEELLGRNAHGTLHRDGHGNHVPRVRCQMYQAFLTGRAAQGSQVWFERGDGSLLSVEWTLIPCDIAAELARGGIPRGAGNGGAPRAGPQPVLPRPVRAYGALVIFYEVPAPYGGTRSQGGTQQMSELDRLGLLVETTTQLLTSTVEVDEALHRLTQLLVPRLADWLVIDVLVDSDQLNRAVVVHQEGDVLVHHPELCGPLPRVPRDPEVPLSRILHEAASMLSRPDEYRGPPDSPLAVTQRRLFEVTGVHTAAVAPIRGPRGVLGVLALGYSERSEAFTDLALLEDIGRRAGIALENARLYQQQRHVAETMQQRLLPRLPSLPNLEMTARYVAAPEGSDVGGDWYDVFRLADDTVVLAIGDVVGHDIGAAASMAQIRSILRAYAWAYEEPPSLVMARLDHAVEHLTDAILATTFFTRVEQNDDGSRTLYWTNAGHPPPLLVQEDGRSRFLDDALDPVIGTGQVRTRTNFRTVLPPAATLVLYTDGLVESPTRSLDQGLSKLQRHAAELAHHSLETFCDLLLNRTRPADNSDDVALLALRRSVS